MILRKNKKNNRSEFSRVCSGFVPVWEIDKKTDHNGDLQLFCEKIKQLKRRNLVLFVAVL